MDMKSDGLNAFEKAMLSRIAQDEIKENIHQFTLPYRKMMAYYRCAMMQVETKFNVMDEELSLQYDRNPIETIKTRLKSPESIANKLIKKQAPLTVESIEQNISDVAGVRVICSFPSDIYMLADALLKQDDITLLKRKDYIANPKENGYRSLHLIVQTPIFLHDQKRLMKVEVQFRTISMDWWASLEHKICYKKDVHIFPEIGKELRECAEIGEILDRRMEMIQQKVESGNS
ncbi:MAG: GTP pyrophosphokinase family protein [Clostridia bacterium]|nr:GTP pyrophosphokinase family protein [Clostridia bacterium]